jgi:hypothetical protein
MFSFFRSLGQTLGVAIGGNIFQNILKSKINKDPLLLTYGKADSWSKDASALVLFIKALPISQQTLSIALVKVYVDSLRIVWIVMCVLRALRLFWL